MLFFQIQIIGYNTDLYQNFTEALLSTHGLAVLAILGTVSLGPIIATIKHTYILILQRHLLSTRGLYVAVLAILGTASL